MRPTYDVLAQGNNLRLRDNFLAVSTIVLIRAKSGLTLFDAGGLASRLGLLKALKGRGLEPRDIPTVFLSHLHHDHTYNVDLFPHARFLVSRREWDYAGAPHPDDLFMPWGIREQLGKSTVELVEGEGQLDPGVTFFPAPGHTPGAMRSNSARRRAGSWSWPGTRSSTRRRQFCGPATWLSRRSKPARPPFRAFSTAPIAFCPAISPS
jgi:glyoxylase-like metal-dependent hydrolase (beta-lactamase superfamily II)